MKPALIFYLLLFIIPILFYLIAWIVGKIISILTYVKHSKLLASIEKKICSVPLIQIESKIKQLDSATSSLFEQLESKHKVRLQEESISLQQYILDDQDIQQELRKKPARSSRPCRKKPAKSYRPYYFRRRWY